MTALLCLANLTLTADTTGGQDVLALAAVGLLTLIALVAATNRPAQPPPVILQLPAQPAESGGGCLTALLVAILGLVALLLLAGRGLPM